MARQDLALDKNDLVITNGDFVIAESDEQIKKQQYLRIKILNEL